MKDERRRMRCALSFLHPSSFLLGLNDSVSEASSLLDVRGIRKHFPGVLALDGVSLNVQRGEVLAVVGENGAGKSTLMKILAGIYRPDAGEMLLNGQVVHLTGVADALRR